MKKLDVIIVYAIYTYFDEEEGVYQKGRMAAGLFPHNKEGEKIAKEFAISLKKDYEKDYEFEIADVITSLIIL